MNKLLDLTVNNYLTKEEFSQKLGKEFTPEIWKEIKDYRKRFVNSANLEFDKKMCFVSMTPYIISKYITVEKLFMKLDKKSFQYGLVNRTSTLDYLVPIKLQEIKEIILAHGHKINDSILKDIFLNKDIKIDKDEEFANSVCRGFETLIKGRDEFSRNNLADIYKTFETYSFIRQRSVKKRGKEVGLPISTINSAFDRTIKFVEQNNMPTVIKSIVVNFYYRNAIFNEEYNDLMSFIAMDLVLSGEGYKHYMSMIDFIGTALKDADRLTESFKMSVNARGDVTYYVDYILSTLIKSLTATINYLDLELSVDKTISKSEKLLRASSKKLLMKHISLKKKQSWFLVNHCEINMNYTIQDYRAFNKTSYETSRYSMDNLAKLNFYKKTKNGKKYIYTCINDKVLKG